MATLLKNLYNDRFFNSFSSVATGIVPGFKKDIFLERIYSNGWENKELKQRMKHMAVVLKSFLPDSYEKNIITIRELILAIRQKGLRAQSIEYLFFPEFIETYGTEHLDISLQAMETVTQFVSCEFAIRPYLIMDQKKVIRKMLEWSKHKNEHVRRFASEGSRPRLPWAMAVPSLKKDPSDILPILEILKNDPSEYVRRSVANNLNDISKDHPQLVIDTTLRWKGESAFTDKIIRHACRSLLKKANGEVLEMFGLRSPVGVEIKEFQLNKKSIEIGETLSIQFTMVQKQKKKMLIRIEFGVYYAKANNKQSRKLFRVTENVFEPEKEYVFNRNLSFRDLTTRKHYPGKHNISIVVNGSEIAEKGFILK